MVLAMDLFFPELAILEIFLRGTVVYWAIFLFFRLGGRRNIGSLGFADIVVLLLVAEAVGDSLGGGDESITGGLGVAAVIVCWSFAIDRLCYFYPLASKVLEPSKLCLIENGKMDLKNMRAEYVTRAELMEQLRLQGVSSLEQISRAYLEKNGELSIIKRDEECKQGTPTYLDVSEGYPVERFPPKD
jgi:uncharacterized membrane protein YcaP (DUF421 family)